MFDFVKKLFSDKSKQKPTPVPPAVDWLSRPMSKLTFFSINGVIQFFTIKHGAKASMKELQHILSLVPFDKDNLVAQSNQINHINYSFDDARRLLREAGVAETTDYLTNLVVAIATHVYAVMGELEMNGDVLTLKDGRRIGIQILWSDKLPDGNRASLFTLIVPNST